MGFEDLGKKLGAFASVTAKKAGEQVQITRLGIDRAGLEKEVEEVYAAIGRFCYTRLKAGNPMAAEIGEYCVDIDALRAQIAEIDEEIARRKTERDAPESPVEPSETAEAPVIVAETVEASAPDLP
ncbi:MAG: hypothetical protein RR197_03590, partial [Oscillospiraceae bacterium]